MTLALLTLFGAAAFGYGMLHLFAWMTRRRLNQVVAFIKTGEKSSLELYQKFGSLVYLDLRELEDLGQITSRTEQGGPERGYRKHHYYRVEK